MDNSFKRFKKRAALFTYEPVHEISNNVVCATKQRLRPACACAQSDQSLCLSLDYSMSVKLLTEHLLGGSKLKRRLQLSKCQIVGNHMPRLNYANIVLLMGHTCMYFRCSCDKNLCL